MLEASAIRLKIGVADREVMYSDNNDNPVWATQTNTGDNTVVCVVRNEGDFVLYSGTKIWSSKSM